MILADAWAIRGPTEPPMPDLLPNATKIESSPEENQKKSIVNYISLNNLEV